MSQLSRTKRFLAPTSALAIIAAVAALGGVACGTEAIDPNGSGGSTPGASGAGSGGASGAGTSGSAGSGGSGVPGGSGGESAPGGAGGATATGGFSGAGASGGMAGVGAAGGAGASGGAGATAGATGAGGAGAGASGLGGADAMGGTAGSSGTAGAAGTAGSSGTAGAAGSTGVSPKPYFSFFVTSMEGLLSLAPDPVNGFGGDLRFGEQTGLAGADKICTTLAQRASPGDTKTWRAFLSTSGLSGGTAVDAIDRVGPGPWYDFNGRLFASNVAGLLTSDGRPDGDPQLMEMFTDENGVAISPNDEDNHDTLTGSNAEGRLFEMDAAATCDDWTSSTTHGTVPVGHSWPRSQSNGREWIQDHTVNGCEPGINISGGGGAPMGNYTVGGGGGFGAIYCFALGAVPP